MNSASSDQELEVKFYISRRKALEEKLISQGGQLKAPRVHETNLRMDTPEHSLLESGRLLRLRMDTRARVTYKGTGSVDKGARLRQELEFTVSDFDTTRAVFEALGYQVTMMYEKYRTTYTLAALGAGTPATLGRLAALGAGQLGDLEVTLDEMPYGDFAEIEGPDGESIQNVAQQLGLDWETRNLDSYTVLFERARAKLGFEFRDLSFENFREIQVTPDALGVRAADKD